MAKLGRPNLSILWGDKKVKFLGSSSILGNLIQAWNTFRPYHELPELHDFSRLQIWEDPRGTCHSQPLSAKSTIANIMEGARIKEIHQLWNGRESNWKKVEQLHTGNTSGSTKKIAKTVHIDREHTVFPAHPSNQKRIDLTTLDLIIVSVNYSQKGLLYEMPDHSLSAAVSLLEKSLSQVLTRFYPLAGRLTTSPSDGAIYIDCNDAGAAFIEASAEDVSVREILAADVTVAGVDHLFALNGAVCLDGHRLPLLAVQVTKLRDGIFIACSINHMVVDGVALWHFFNSWAEICSGAQEISVNPILDRLQSPARLNLDPDDIRRFTPPPLRVKFFHFSKDMVRALKDRANLESPVPVSSLQAHCAHVWQAVTRARRLGGQDATSFLQVADCRSRMVPPLPSSYFASCMGVVRTTTSAGEVASDVSVPAQLLQRMIHNHGDVSIKKRIEDFNRNPKPNSLESIGKVHKNSVMLASSPRFKMYETDFGWGRPLAARSGPNNKFDGYVQAYPGKEGYGSVDLEICLAPNVMGALELDQHFLNPLLI